ncbi:DcaP family trimeric outer membrane transporter [Bacteroides sp. 519]|uniref:DcaP family trimeric outer membrane transporter n=1 Tax=Bacteroides sp. 519 TaxID=2302937 RepID=UPI0013D35ABC|nr:DcaP family trimeric outer membrane transporter [Bacteroides sp. 519]NDV60250.1 hypothetical protein [Bacteroides sp. 519]
MKVKFKIICSLLLMGLFSLNCLAQNDNESNYLLFKSYNKAGKEVIDVTDVTRQIRFHDPQAPRFVLVDSNGNFSLGIGGNVRAVAEYDFGGVVDNVDFYPSLITTPGTNGDYARNKFQMDASSSSLFVKLVGKTKTLGNFTVYVNGYFRGSNSTFKLHHAYVAFLGFTAGYDYGTFTDANAAPATVDFEGPAGQVLYRTTLLRYARVLSRNWSFGVAVEVPQVNAITNDNTTVKTQRAPDFPAYIQYNWGKSSHFRVAGIVRTMTYSSIIDQKAYSQTGWGVQGGMSTYPLKNLKLVGQITYGKGIGYAYNDLGKLNMDLVPDPDRPGRMQILPMLGWYAGLQYNITPKVFVSGTYSQSRIYTNNGYPVANSNTYRYGQYLVANTFWNINSNMKFGAEYLRGWKTDFNETNSANRVSLLMQYSF